ncbi:MAG: hypothetical protein PVI54_07610, partial [Desulfobacteraceae bacterium]
VLSKQLLSLVFMDFHVQASLYKFIKFINIGFKIMLLDSTAGGRGITIRRPPPIFAKNIILKPLYQNGSKWINTDQF